MGAVVFGAGAERLPNTVYFALPNLDGETLVGQLDREGYAVASGSACSSSSPEVSHVLSAMGVSPELARGAVRISLGADNTMEQIEGFLLTLQKTLEKMQRLAAIAV
jgi:cysteine desulfurase